MTISVVIPCRNEAEGIAKVIQSVPKGVSEIIVVDNNSTDDTGKIAAVAGAKVVFEPRPGHGSAVRAGFKHATGDIIAALDGDGQYPARAITEIAQFLEVNGFDFVSASRFPLSNPKVMSRIRMLGNIFLTKAANTLFWLNSTDILTSMLVFRRSVLDTIRLESDGMPFSSEIKIRAHRRRFRMGEYHIPYATRLGESKLVPWKHGFVILMYFLRLRFGR